MDDILFSFVFSQKNTFLNIFKLIYHAEFFKCILILEPFVDQNQPGGLIIQEMNDEKTILFKSEIPSVNFDKFFCRQKIILDVRCYPIITILERQCGNYQTIELKKSNPYALCINMINWVDCVRLAHYNIFVHGVSFDYKIAMDRKEIESSYNCLSASGPEIIEFEISNDNFSLSNTKNRCKIFFVSANNIFNLQLPINSVMSNRFSLQNLKKFSWLGDLNENTEFYFKENFMLAQVIRTGIFGTIVIYFTPLNMSPNKSKRKNDGMDDQFHVKCQKI